MVAQPGASHGIGWESLDCPARMAAMHGNEGYSEVAAKQGSRMVRGLKHGRESWPFWVGSNETLLPDCFADHGETERVAGISRTARPLL